jgi:transposase-like protein
MVAMQNSRLIRKHLTPQQREKILQDHQGSGLTDKEFARQAGVAVATLYAWRRKAASNPRPNTTPFVSVPNLLAAVPAASAYRLHWPGGLSLEVRAGFSVPELAALLRLLPAL